MSDAACRAVAAPERFGAGMLPREKGRTAQRSAMTTDAQACEAWRQTKNGVESHQFWRVL